MKPTDLPLLVSVSDPTVSPDASHAVVAVSRPDLDADAYVGQLWSIPLAGERDGDTPRRLTLGASDSQPAFSPDGSLIAFVRSDLESPPQLHVMRAAGGEPVKVTDQKMGVSSFRWSPDGRQLAFISRVPEHGRYGTVDDLGAAAEPPRHITTLKYRANGVGYTIDRRSHVFLVDVPDVTGEPTYRVAPSPQNPSPEQPAGVPEALQLTSGDHDHRGISFTPDGRILFVSSRHDSRDDDLFSDVYEIGTDGGEPRLLSRERTLGIEDTHVTEDGTVYVLASELGEGRDFVARNAGLYRLENGDAVRLTDAETLDLGGRMTSRPDGTVFVHHLTRGRVELLAVSRAGEHSPVLTGELEVTGSAPAGNAIVVTFTSPTSAGDVGIVRDGTLTRLTDFSSELRAAGIVTPIELTVPARDGYDVHGWVVLPKGEGPHPVLLNIHGGPFAAYTVSVFDEAQVYADAGYAVVMCNPRGSAGYGQAHGRVIRQAMGTVDMTDVLDFLDGATAQHPSLDRDRVGIMGGSYGGYLTAWTIAHDHRFAAAIVERGFLDPEHFVGTSDIGSFFGDEYTGTDPELVRSQSPQAVVDRVTTPTLVLHSEEDWRCPLSQAERYFAALKRQGTEAELLVFPGENHELSRSGRPRHRVQRFEAILGWWERHLPVS